MAGDSMAGYSMQSRSPRRGWYGLALGLSFLVSFVMMASAYTGGTEWLTGSYTSAHGSASSVAGSSPLSPVVGGVGEIPFRATLQSEVSSSTPVSFDLEIAIPQTSQLAGFLSSLSDASSPNYHHYLTLQEFYARFGPSATDVDSLGQYLGSSGLAVAPTSGPLVYRVSGTAGEVSTAFHVPLYNYRLGTETFIAPYGVPELPQGLAPLVSSLSGLNGFDVPHNMLSHPSTKALPLTAITPAVMRGFYDESSLLSSGSTGTGTIGLAEICDTGENDQGYQNDLNQFDSSYGLPSTTLQFTGSGSSSCTGGSSGWDGETNLDIQWAHAMAPGATILVCLDNSDPSVCDQSFVQSGVPFGSNSWGGGGPYHSIWQSAQAAGITLLSSSGDNGASVSYPAAEPDGLGVGGTSITPQGSSYGSESGWSGSGGGCDANDSSPSWQAGMSGLATVCGSSAQRGVPDVAMDADPNTGVNVVTNGQTQQIGGTSLSSPMWAATLDVIYQSTGFTGFAPPVLYGLAEGSLYSTVFHDITTGNNGMAAGPGWDAVTGVGSPDIAALASHWNSNGGGTTALAAGATASPTSGTAPLSVTFTGSASGGSSPYTYSWTFGDGSSSTAQNPSHTFGTSGTYTATLTVTDSVSASASSSVTITVTSPPAGGGCTSPTSITIGIQVSGNLQTGGCVLYSAVLPQSDWNNYYYLDAYESDGQVSGAQPVATVYAGISPPTVTQSNAAQNKAGPNAAMSISLSTQAANQFGGWGTYEFLIQASPGAGGSFCFVTKLSNSQAGSSPVCSAGGGGSPLSASASASPTSGAAPLAVAFTGTASGGSSPYTYSWAFGDGSSSASQSPSHTYSAAGTYSATLTVTDSGSKTATSSITISVTSPPNGGGCASPTAITIGTQVSGSLQTGGCALFSATLSQSAWNNYYYFNAYETDGQLSGSQPVVTLYAGMSPPTLTSANAAQSQAGPNAAMSVSLTTQAQGQYGGWGTYEFMVQASSTGSGRFCFVVQLSNSQAGSSPACTALAATPAGTIADSVTSMGGHASTPPSVSWIPLGFLLILVPGVLLPKGRSPVEVHRNRRY